MSVLTYVPVRFFRKLNEFAPALTLLGVIAGFAWAGGRSSAQLEAVRQDVQGLHRTVEAVQTDVRSVQETLPHMVSCMIDLQRFAGGPGTNMAGLEAEDAQPPLPASCEHALARTTLAQGD